MNDLPPAGLQHAERFVDAAGVLSARGREVGVGDWLVVDQARIDRFAQATGDFQWIHVDPERAAAESPYGGTIAHGFLTLSLLGGTLEAYLQHALPFCGMGLNYGLNKVRFTSPVPAGCRVRIRLALVDSVPVEGGLQITFGATIDVEHQKRPACIAESVIRRLFRVEAQAA